MTALALPALDGRSPLGFLAALGILRLVTERHHPGARLAWSTQDCVAILHDAHTSIEELAADLQTIIDDIPEGGVLPDLPADFPPLGEAPDKLRLPRRELRKYATDLHAGEGAKAERWLSSLVTDISLDDKGRADISLFTAPSGKQSMRTMLTKPLVSVRRIPASLTEALVGWRRYAGVTGEYLDHRVLHDAADAPDGRPAERGVPAATWLALMAYPLFLTTGVGREPLTTGWQFVTARRSARRLVYPLWSTPVGVDTAVTLLEHPVLAGAQPGPASARMRTASIFLVCAAERQRLEGRTFAGVLTTIRPRPRKAARSTPARRQSSPRGPVIL